MSCEKLFPLKDMGHKLLLSSGKCSVYYFCVVLSVALGSNHITCLLVSTQQLSLKTPWRCHEFSFWEATSLYLSLTFWLSWHLWSVILEFPQISGITGSCLDSHVLYCTPETLASHSIETIIKVCEKTSFSFFFFGKDSFYNNKLALHMKNVIVLCILGKLILGSPLLPSYSRRMLKSSDSRVENTIVFAYNPYTPFCIL